MAVPTKMKVVTNTKAQKKNEQVVFILDSPRAKSTVQRKSTSGKVIEYLDTAETFSIPLTGKIPNGNGDGLVEVAYLVGVGVNTLYVDDYTDKDGKIHEGIRTKLGQNFDKKFREGYRKALEYTSKLTFKSGKLTLSTEGENGRFVKYLMMCEFNTSNEHYEQMNKINKGGILKFHVEAAEKEAELLLAGLEVDARAALLVSTLSNKIKDGYEYDADQINALCTMFGIGAGIPTEDYARRVIEIRNFSLKDGQKFMDFYDGQTYNYKMGIAHAIELQVINIQKEKAFFKNDNREFYEFRNKKEAEKVEELVLYFLGEGEKDYKEMNILLDAAKKLMLK